MMNWTSAKVMFFLLVFIMSIWFIIYRIDFIDNVKFKELKWLLLIPR